MTPLQLTGQRFGRLVALERNGSKWSCRCDCGATKVALAANLSAGRTRSCGCFQAESAKSRATTHGGRRRREYAVWQSMHNRCRRAAGKDYPRYGARGIRVCERWADFEAFFADMGERPAGMTLDRRDNDGHYSPGNCRWATSKQQARNRGSSRLISAFGQVLPLSAWADDSRCSVTCGAIAKRIKSGMSPELAITKPRERHAA